jgi:hypothetical protein
VFKIKEIIVAESSIVANKANKREVAAKLKALIIGSHRNIIIFKSLFLSRTVRS